MRRKRKQKAVKIVRVRYGPLGRPHHKNIEKTINKWERRGYRLEDQREVTGGCFTGGALGYTRLTFRVEQDA